MTTWGYGDHPGAPIRVTAGDRLRIAVTNDLPVETSVHWHGLRIDNTMDGVPDPDYPGRGSRRDLRLRLRGSRPGYPLVPSALGAATRYRPVCAP